VAEAVAALGRSSGHEATHHAPSEQGLSQTLLEELLTLLSEQPPPLEGSSADQMAETQRAELSERGVHPYICTGGACDLPRSAGNRGSKTVTGFAVERFLQFGFGLVFPRAGTEYYLLIDKADRSSQLLTDPIFS